MGRGASGALTATLSATEGFAGTVSLSCVGTNTITCVFTPSTLQPSGADSATTKITIVASNAATSSPSGSYVTLNLVALASLLLVGLILRGGRTKRGIRTGFFFVVLALLMVAASLSWGGGGSGSITPTDPGGSNRYAITVIATSIGTQ